MACYEHELLSPPRSQRARELWLQHAAGFILFEDVRRYALERIGRSASPSSRAAARKAIDDALYGLMMVIDGVGGAIESDEYQVAVQMSVVLARRGKVIEEFNLSEDGDGMCMGYHGWRGRDFGEDPVTRRKPPPPLDASADPRRRRDRGRTAKKRRN